MDAYAYKRILMLSNNQNSQETEQAKTDNPRKRLMYTSRSSSPSLRERSLSFCFLSPSLPPSIPSLIQFSHIRMCVRCVSDDSNARMGSDKV